MANLHEVELEELIRKEGLLVVGKGIVANALGQTLTLLALTAVLAGVGWVGQAVLIGRADEPAARLTSDNDPLVDAENTNTWTWYRIVMPVNARTLNPEP